MTSAEAGPGLGRRATLAWLVVSVVLVGAMVGQERTVVPLIARDVFGLESFTAALAFIVTFGSGKALTNFVAGRLVDRVGRRPVLVGGWLIGIPVPLLLLWAPTWEWVLVSNLLLGVNQGLTWTATLVMKIDVVHGGRRGFAAGMNEAGGYLGVAGAAWLTGYLASVAGVRTAPFVFGLAAALAGFLVAAVVIPETRGTPSVDAPGLPSSPVPPRGPLWTASQAGFVNNLNDAAAWGLFPVLFAAAGLSHGLVGLLVALYPALWGAGQLVTGRLSDRVGRRPLIVGGMLLQAVALAAVAMSSSVALWMVASVLLGVGTALVYPTLQAWVWDAASHGRGGSALGVYRFWRDLGLAVGALLLGLAADGLGPRAGIGAAGLITAASGLVVLRLMPETLPRLRR